MLLTIYVALCTNQEATDWEFYFLLIFLYIASIIYWCEYTSEQDINMNKYLTDYENGNIIKIYTVDSENNKIDSTYIYK